MPYKDIVTPEEALETIKELKIHNHEMELLLGIFARHIQLFEERLKILQDNERRLALDSKTTVVPFKVEERRSSEAARAAKKAALDSGTFLPGNSNKR